MIPISELARHTGAELCGDAGFQVQGIAGPEDAGPGDLAPFLHPSFRSIVETSAAGALLVTPNLASSEAVRGRPVLIHKNPRLALARLIPLLRAAEDDASVQGPPLSPEASIDPSARIGAGVVVEPGAIVKTGAVLGHGCIVRRGAIIGEGSCIGPNAVIERRSVIGRHVRIGPGAVIGADGFGFAVDDEGTTIPIPQTGIVIIEDDVSVGANTTIDRATLGATRIRRGARIDNLVQIAHNVEIGSNACIAAQSGVAGSSRIGARVQLGGQVGVADHLVIGDGVRIAAKSGVAGHIPAGETHAGIPAVPIRTWRRLWANLIRAASRKDRA